MEVLFRTSTFCPLWSFMLITVSDPDGSSTTLRKRRSEGRGTEEGEGSTFMGRCSQLFGVPVTFFIVNMPNICTLCCMFTISYCEQMYENYSQ